MSPSQVCSLIHSTYATLPTGQLFQLRLVAHNHRNILAMLALEGVLNDRWSQMEYVEKGRVSCGVMAGLVCLLSDLPRLNDIFARGTPGKCCIPKLRKVLVQLIGI